MVATRFSPYENTIDAVVLQNKAHGQKYNAFPGKDNDAS